MAISFLWLLLTPVFRCQYPWPLIFQTLHEFPCFYFEVLKLNVLDQGFVVSVMKVFLKAVKQSTNQYNTAIRTFCKNTNKCFTTFQAQLDDPAF